MQPSAPHTVQSLMQNPVSVSRWHASKPELKRRLLVTLLTVIFYYYPSLLSTSLSLFACYRIDASYPSSDVAYPQNLQASQAMLLEFCCVPEHPISANACHALSLLLDCQP